MTQTAARDPVPGPDDEPPLDPALARIQARLRRMMLVAGLTLGFGILAVFGAILYRITVIDATPDAARGDSLAAEPAAPPVGVAEEATPALAGLPADARLLSSALDGDRLALIYADRTGTHVLVVNLPTLQVVSRTRLASGDAATRTD